MKVYGSQFVQALKQAAENKRLVSRISELMKVDEGTVTSSIDFAVGKELRPHDKELDKDLILDYQLETFENLVQLAHEEGLSGDVANAIFFIAGRLSQARKISSLQNNEGKLRDYSAAARNTLRNNHLDYIVQYPELELVNQ